MVFYTNRAVYSYVLGIWQSDICKQVVFWFRRNKLTANGLLNALIYTLIHFANSKFLLH